MTLTSSNFMLVGAILLMAGVLIQKPGYKYGLPTLLLFLLVGMAFGCDGVGLQFDNVEWAQLVGMVSLSVTLSVDSISSQVVYFVGRLARCGAHPFCHLSSGSRA